MKDSNLLSMEKNSKLYVWILLSLIIFVVLSFFIKFYQLPFYSIITFLVLIIILYNDRNKLSLGLFYIYLFLIFISQILIYYFILISGDWGLGGIIFIPIWIGKSLILAFIIVFFEVREYKKTGHFKIVQDNNIIKKISYIFSFLLIICGFIILAILIGPIIISGNFEAFNYLPIVMVGFGSGFIFFGWLRFLLEKFEVRFLYFLTFIGLIIILFTSNIFYQDYKYDLPNLYRYIEMSEEFENIYKLAIEKNDVTLCKKETNCLIYFAVKTKNTSICYDLYYNNPEQCIKSVAIELKDKNLCYNITGSQECKRDEKGRIYDCYYIYREGCLRELNKL